MVVGNESISEIASVTYFVTCQRFPLIRFQLLHRFHDVSPADDGIALEYAASAPPADLHNDRFGYPRTAQISSRCPAEVVEY